MNWEITYIDGKNYVRIVSTGIFNVKELPRGFDALLSSDFWKKGIPLLFDNSDLSFENANFGAMKEASICYLYFAERLGPGKAVLLMKSAANFGFGRQFQFLAEDKGERQIRVYSNEAEALDWLLDPRNLAHY